MPWKEQVAAARKRFEALPTSQLLDIQHDTIDWDNGPEGEAYWSVLDARAPFDTIDRELGEHEKTLNELDEELGKKVEKLTDRIDELWKALRTHHHTDGRVVREV